MQQIRGWLIGLFIFGGLSALAVFNASRPRILVLHSGTEDSLWVQDVDRGMTRELERDRGPVQISRHYLRLDRPGTSPEAVRLAVEDAERAIARLRPEILIAVDDEANSLVASPLVNRSSNGDSCPKVLYVSIDQAPEVYGYVAKPGVTGISEALPLAAVRDALGDLRGPGFPDLAEGKLRLRIAAIARSSETGRAELEQVRRFDWSPGSTVELAEVGDWAQWQEQTRQLAGKADVVLVLSYFGLPRQASSKELVPGQELAQWMESESGPLPVGLHVDYVTDGGGFSLAPAPLNYGEGAMQMALQWLRTGREGELPKAWQSTHFDVALRAGRLAQRGLHLPPVYAEAARAGDDFYED